MQLAIDDDIAQQHVAYCGQEYLLQEWRNAVLVLLIVRLQIRDNLP